MNIILLQIECFGILSTDLGREFKEFNMGTIVLSEFQRETAKRVSLKAKEVIEDVYERFHEYDIMDFFKIIINSPMYREVRNCGEGKGLVLNKFEIKEWYKDTFL